MRHLPPVTGLLLLGILLLHGAALNGAIVFVNGDFESNPSEIMRLSGGTAIGGTDTSWLEGDLAGWDVGPSGNNPSVLATNQNLYYATISNGNPAGGGPHGGSLAAVFPSAPLFDSYISQKVINTVAGEHYQISFWLSNQIGDISNNSFTVNFGGIISVPGGPVTGGTDLLGPISVVKQVGWTQYTFDAVAPTNDARLTFMGGNNTAGTLLDDVVVTPEPSTVTLLGAGVALMGTRRRRRTTR